MDERIPAIDGSATTPIPLPRPRMPRPPIGPAALALAGLSAALFGGGATAPAADTVPAPSALVTEIALPPVTPPTTGGRATAISAIWPDDEL